jgi:glycosyltransferase involved in cell wall biosynthesis
MIKVLALALYGPLAASHRYRLGQYVSGLSSMGVEMQIRHLLGDDYLRARFTGGPLPIASMVNACRARFENLWYQNEFDAIMLQCELVPLMPGWLERTLIRKPYLYDFDDAFYLKYRSSRMRFLTPLLGKKFDAVMSGAAAVTAGNHVLAGYAKQHNANTHYLPTVVDTTHYLPQMERRGSTTFTVGWIGSPSTSTYLGELVAPLSLLGQEGPVRLIVIGGKAPKIPNVEMIEIEWNENTEIGLINSFDVGVMPLPDDEWARGKCAFKLVQYMACAVPVIASPVGANVDLVTSECGLLALDTQEWLDALRKLRDQPGIRSKMGEAGRARVVAHYSLHLSLPILANVFSRIV